MDRRWQGATFARQARHRSDDLTSCTFRRAADRPARIAADRLGIDGAARTGWPLNPVLAVLSRQASGPGLALLALWAGRSSRAGIALVAFRAFETSAQQNGGHAQRCNGRESARAPVEILHLVFAPLKNRRYNLTRATIRVEFGSLPTGRTSASRARMQGAEHAVRHGLRRIFVTAPPCWWPAKMVLDGLGGVADFSYWRCYEGPATGSPTVP